MEHIVINEQNMSLFAPLIPEFFQQDVLEGRLLAMASYEEKTELPGEELPQFVVGASLLRRRDRWLEIVWAGLSEDFEDTEWGGVMLREHISTALLDEKLVGAFAEFDPKEEEFAKILTDAGLTVEYTLGSLFSFTAGMVKWPPLGKNLAGKKSMCTPLGETDNVRKNRLLELIGKDPREVPFLAPINWNEYDPELSWVYLQPDGYGVILISDRGDHYMIDLVAAATPLAIGCLMSVAIDTVKHLCGLDAKLMASAVNKEAEQMVLRYVPDAQRNRLAQAFVRF